MPSLEERMKDRVYEEMVAVSHPFTVHGVQRLYGKSSDVPTWRGVFRLDYLVRQLENR